MEHDVVPSATFPIRVFLVAESARSPSPGAKHVLVVTSNDQTRFHCQSTSQRYAVLSLVPSLLVPGDYCTIPRGGSCTHPKHVMLLMLYI